MVSRYLITTADQRTWKTEMPLLFLGKWCLLYSEKDKWETLDYECVSYHWNDREQLFQDYQYMSGFYERTLESLSESLNRHHGVSHSLRYWRIFIGPWLYYFIQMVFDRWQMIHRAVEGYDISGTTVLSIDPESLIPHHFAHFGQFYSGDDLWNHWIYGRVLETIGDVPLETVAVDDNLILEQIKPHSLRRRIVGLGKAIVKKTLFLTDCLSKSNDYFFISTTCSILDQARLGLALGQLPTFPREPVLSPIHIDRSVRDAFSVEMDSADRFERFLMQLIPAQIPRYYLEGYKSLQNKIENSSWPGNPKVIFTANAIIGADYFKLWAAEKAEKGSKLILGQHGGSYGISKWSSNEAHEVSVSDRYISWGWTGAERIKPLPSPRLNHVVNRLAHDPGGRVLLVQAAAPRYSYWLHSVPVAAQLEGYLEDQIRFAECLSPVIRDELLVRLYPYDYGWCQKQRWLDRLPGIKYDSHVNTMYVSIRKSRLFIGTYNATTFLETFSANFPTVLFWNCKQWEIRISAQPYFDKLRSVGILHETPESAAHLVNEIYRDPMSWWLQPEIQEAKNQFCNRFARTSDKWLQEWKEGLFASDKDADGDYKL